MTAAKYSRRTFIQQAGLAAAAMLGVGGLSDQKVPVSAHLWVYASKFPPDWDCTPVLETVFSDLKYGGYNGVEMMESNLRHKDAVLNIGGLSKHYGLPVTGSSYNNELWNAGRKNEIMEDVSMIVERLAGLRASTFGISVGDVGRRKTEAELDAQAKILEEMVKICNTRHIVANLHNHTYEVRDGLYDLKGTLTRIPGIKLVPDLNWFVRAGVDPVSFINTYGRQMVYMHIRDQYASGKWTEYVGQGVTDFKGIANALKRVQFAGRAAVELAFDTAPVYPLKEDWKRSRQYVEKVFGW